jgi:hypothetical protein
VYTVVSCYQYLYAALLVLDLLASLLAVILCRLPVCHSNKHACHKAASLWQRVVGVRLNLLLPAITVTMWVLNGPFDGDEGDLGFESKSSV